MNRTLPLFPLDTVLFPGAPASLQIFEPRYREMLRDCMAGDRKFGIVLIKSGRSTGPGAEPYKVGTMAHILDIGAPRRGAIPIEVVGESRFRIVQENRIRQYLSAEVEMLDDGPVEMVSDDLVLAAHDATAHYLGTILASQGVFQAEPEIPADPVKLSYFIGSISTTARNRTLQKLLETDRLDNRLQAGIAILEEETNRLQDAFMRSGPGRERSLFSTN